MFLNNIVNAYVGDKEVTSIYLGSRRIFPPVSYGVWQFDQIPSTISNVSITTYPADDITIEWGDGSEDTISSGDTINKTFV
jgi:hypothetical protein